MRKFAALLALCAGFTAQAQTFPARPVTLIVPFPPGGSTDTAARIIGERMRGPLGQTVVIENVGGAGGTIALQRVARANPDGYTIDIGPGARRIAPSAQQTPQALVALQKGEIDKWSPIIKAANIKVK